MSRHYKKHPKRNKFKKRKKQKLGLLDYLGLVFLGGLVLYMFVLIAYPCVCHALLRRYGKKTKAVVTGYYDSFSRGGLSTHHFFYKFIFKGEDYWGHTQIDYHERDRIGDSIDVIYLDSWPEINCREEYLN